MSTAVVLSAAQVADQSVGTDADIPPPELTEATPTRGEVAVQPTSAPGPTATPAPQPIPTSEPEPTPDEAVPTPTPVPSPTPGPSPTPEPTPEPGDPPYPVACGNVEPADDPELEALILDELGVQHEHFSVVVHELITGARAEVNADRSYYGASLFKTALMYELFRQVDDGDLSLDEYVTFDDFYVAQDLGTLHLLGWTEGTEVTVADVLEAMITVSDNASAVLLGDLVGWERLDETLADLGAADTEFSSLDLPTTSVDNEIILKAIACAEGVHWYSSQKMLEILGRQTVNNRLPRELPDGAVIVHKTGNWYEANHDTGIVYGPEAIYIIVIMSTYPPGADDIMARLNRAVYDYFHTSEVAEDVHDDD